MYDTIIIGSGPAGMTAAIYLKRAGKNVLVLEKETIGGQMASSPLIENYPGYLAISGSDLANNMYEQLDNLGIDIELEEVLKIEDGEIKKVITEFNTYEAKTIILALGTKHRLLGLPNEKELIGKGVHFCVSCDGAFYKDKNVAVIGGGNSALANALALSEICKKVYLIQDLEYLTGESSLQTKVENKNNTQIFLNSKVVEVVEEKELSSLKIKTNEEMVDLEVEGMFISIGLIPQTDILKELLDLDKFNYVKSDDCTTNISGIFVAGDLRTKAYRQITTATSDGTVAANLTLEYLSK